MRDILNRIFLRKLGIGKFVLSAVAFLTGFSLVLLSLQGYIKIREFVAPRKNASNYIILNKEVGLANTLFGAAAQFSPEEVTRLQQQPFVDDLGVFTTSNFQATAHVGGNLGFYTELFFESVPSQFIDHKPSTFDWHEGDDFLPIIISQDFLNLYNFGFAMGKGTPQLSKSTIQLVPLKINVYGMRGRHVFTAKVVGFSERISSILVPDRFLTWANENIGDAAPQKASRIIVKLKSNETASLESYLRQERLKVSDEKMKFSKVLGTLNVVMSVLVIIGTAFMIFALVIVMLNFSLMVAQAREEVSLLLQLGYKARHLTRHLSLYLLIFMSCVVVLSAILVWVGNSQLIHFLNENGVETSSGIATEVVLVATGFIIASVSLSYFSIRRLIRSVQ